MRTQIAHLIYMDQWIRRNFLTNISLQDFQLQVLERKVARLQGERSDEEREALAEKIKILNEQYENLADTKVFLEDQMKKLNDDLRRGERELSKSTDEKDYLATKIDELNLHNDSSQRSLKKMTSEKDDLMVCELGYALSY